MNKLEKFKNEIKNKKVAVIGIGVSNKPLIKTLIEYGALVTAKDKNIDLGEIKIELESLGVKFDLGDDYLKGLNKFDYIFRSPGVKPFLPEIKEAKENGVIITSEIEEVVNLAPCKTIGITGSDGKTTTTTIIGNILKEAGYNVHVGGNIGTPIFSKLEQIKENDIIVLELSSFQLMTFKSSTNISVITNISPNHLDYHNDYEEYILSKANIFLKDGNKELVLNADDEITDKFKAMYNNKLKLFSLGKKLTCGAYLKENKLWYNDTYICDEKDVKLVGIHNIANFLTAITAVFEMVKIEDILKVVKNFSGVSHRMELINSDNNIKWYNDSIASSPTRTIAGLKSFEDKIILIAGGYDKKISYEPLGKYLVDKVKILILLGDTASKIKEVALKYDMEKTIKIVERDNMEEAVKYAKSVATQNDKIVMSPASASFDKYKNFEERGNHFTSLVNNFKNS